MILIFFNVLGHVLWPTVWLVLVNIPCAPEHSVNSGAIRSDVCRPFRPTRQTVLFKSSASYIYDELVDMIAAPTVLGGID
jgi:hypothetical protein